MILDYEFTNRLYPRGGEPVALQMMLDSSFIHQRIYVPRARKHYILILVKVNCFSIICTWGHWGTDVPL